MNTVVEDINLQIHTLPAAILFECQLPENIVNDLNSKGYHVLDTKLSEEFCDNIVKSIENTPFWNKNKKAPR